MSTRSSSRVRKQAEIYNVGRSPLRTSSGSGSGGSAGKRKRSASTSGSRSRSSSAMRGSSKEDSRKRSSSPASKKARTGASNKSSSKAASSSHKKKASGRSGGGSASSSKKKKTSSTKKASTKKSSAGGGRSRSSSSSQKKGSSSGRSRSRVGVKNPRIAAIPNDAEAGEGEHDTPQHNPRTEAKRMAHFTEKEKKQAEHIESGYEAKGMGSKKAKAIAFATVNKIRAKRGETKTSSE